MRGEEGCGKTSLILIIWGLKINEMKILNIEAVIFNNDTLQFMIDNKFNGAYNDEFEKD